MSATLPDDYLYCIEREISQCLREGEDTFYKLFWDRQGLWCDKEGTGMCAVNACITSESQAADNGTGRRACGLNEQEESVALQIEISNKRCNGSRRRVLACKRYVIKLLCQCYNKRLFSANNIRINGAVLNTVTDPEQTDEPANQVVISVTLDYVVNMCDGVIIPPKNTAVDKLLNNLNDQVQPDRVIYSGA